MHDACTVGYLPAGPEAVGEGREHHLADSDWVVAEMGGWEAGWPPAALDSLGECMPKFQLIFD